MNRLKNMSKIDKLRLTMIVLLFLLIVTFGSIEMYKTYSKSETMIKSKTELQTFLNDTCWIREDKDQNVDLIIFSQFMDIYDATLNGNEEIYNKPAAYKILDYSNVEVFSVLDENYNIRLIGKHELIVKDKNTIIFNNEKYKKEEDLAKWFKKIYYD